MAPAAAHRAALVAGLALALPAAAQEAGARVEVPSGQEVRFIEARRDAGAAAGLTAGITWRFRFVAPAISRVGGTVNLDTAAQDMEHLCNRFALPWLPQGEAVGQIVIELADREVEFGQPAPEATRYFEAFSVQGGRCVWEGF
ncbi:hypothetical protein SAMN05216257_102277 [Meinhardsimonia xiamenensis]|jgi:hypothetical protein|uniref:Acetolactate synthase n=1 Tax=Meinhardsimonia xiamenensis TaxID=990712 RepID=A0A1G9ATY0_9RHOB|nr:DUF6497 family protein [Meinhardsimonia xiamenensis]PRX35247.1 hypothetical protein LV81_01842 [Meinhardsimonia xiamenensis]SDK30762.1 hypothetical protein SAMN05216257_102277 [Meinhardsimonia xiamenensis]